MSISLLNSKEKEFLLELAKQSILDGLEGISPEDKFNCDFDKLREEGASFVTLYLRESLRGCIGSLYAYQSLALDVMQNAYNAAFRDSRFRPLSLSEFKDTSLSISVLSKPESIDFESEEELLAILKPGIDGLILGDGVKRATFLPSVWSQLKDPEDFLLQLKLKAGFSADTSLKGLKISRYFSEDFS